MRSPIATLALALLTLSASAQEPWRSALYPENWETPHTRQNLDFLTDSFLQDFSYAGYHMGSLPLIPQNQTLYNAVHPFGADPSGLTDSTAAIQAAIDHAAQNGGGIVFLPEGSYQLSMPANQDACLRIDTSNITLRGDGSDRTFLFNTTYQMRIADIIRIRPPDWGSWTSLRSTPILLAQDALGPTRRLTLQNVQDLAPLDWIVIHNPATAEFVADLKMGPGADSVDWSTQLENLRGTRILRQITAVDSTTNTIEIDIPTRWYLKTRDAAQVYKTSSRLNEVALESFSIGNRRIPGTDWGEEDYTDSEKSAYHAHSSKLIQMRGVVNGWIQDVSSYNPQNDNNAHMLSNGVNLEWCRNITLYRLKLQAPQFGGGGGNGYMIRLNSANECLVVDSEVGFCRHGIVMWRMENSGNVVTRCYDHDSGVQMANDGIETTSGRGSDHHGIFSHSNLFDSNRVERSYLEAAYRGDWGGNPDHGTTSSQSVFWNTHGIAYHNNADYIVHSQQMGHGYIIGTQGSAAQIRLSEKRTNSQSRTDPLDLTEGIGLGDTLYPPSLYQDQLNRRTSPASPSLQLQKPPNKPLSLNWETSPSLPWDLQQSSDLLLWEDAAEPVNASGQRTPNLTDTPLYYRLKAFTEK